MIGLVIPDMVAELEVLFKQAPKVEHAGTWGCANCEQTIGTPLGASQAWHRCAARGGDYRTLSPITGGK